MAKQNLTKQLNYTVNQPQVIDIPITDGKVNTEKNINMTALAFILRVRSRLDNENKTSAP